MENNFVVIFFEISLCSTLLHFNVSEELLVCKDPNRADDYIQVALEL
jgi:hypothetical protein